MEEIYLRGKRVKVDIRGELEKYDWGNNYRWTEDKLIASSPFRYDKKPSFFVNLTGEFAGTWKDSGSEFKEWESGNFIKLLSFLQGVTYEETEEYLAQVYGVELTYDTLELESPNLTLTETRNPLPADFMTPYRYRHGYLGERGITEKVQRMMRIGYDKERNAVVIPWIDQHGRIVNAKFRSVKGKVFWYAKDALPIKHNVYGIDAIYGVRAKRAVLCEAEIDALTWMSWGVPAIAVGGAYLSERQADIIIRSPIIELVMGADNDEKGAQLNNAVVKRLGKYKTLYKVQYPLGYKDANEIMVATGMPPQILPYENFNKLTL